jgi:ADP-ribose pyrophosphatase
MRAVIPKDASLIPSNAKRVFKGIIYDVYHWPQKLFDGTTATFEMLKRQDSIKVIAIHNGRIIFVEDEQPNSAPHLTLPGGRNDVDGETELECAKRELLEETGMQFKTWKLIGIKQISSEIDWLTYIFVANDLKSKQEPHIEAGERISVRELTYDEALTVTSGYRTLAFAVGLMREAGSIEGLLALPEYKA